MLLCVPVPVFPTNQITGTHGFFPTLPLMVTCLVNKFPTFHTTQRLIMIPRPRCYWTLSWASWIQFLPTCPILRSILIVSSLHTFKSPRLCLLFMFSVTKCYMHFSSSLFVLCAWPVHPLITVMIFWEVLTALLLMIQALQNVPQWHWMSSSWCLEGS